MPTIQVNPGAGSFIFLRHLRTGEVSPANYNGELFGNQFRDQVAQIFNTVAQNVILTFNNASLVDTQTLIGQGIEEGDEIGYAFRNPIG